MFRSIQRSIFSSILFTGVLASAQEISTPPPAASNPAAVADDSLAAIAEMEIDGAGDPNLLMPDTISTTPTGNAVVNLVNLLVERGIIAAGDAAGLIRQAEDEAALINEQTRIMSDAAAQVSAAAAEEVAYNPDDIRVTYIPETVRMQIRDELKRDIMDQAIAENWAAPRSMPEWTQRITLFGDIRARHESIFFPEGNDNTGSFPSFNSINTGSPFDTAGFVFSPQQNVDTDRQRQRLRVRMGLRADLGDGFTAGLRIATGNDSSPVSTNQTLGADGGFSKYSLWLDRGYIKFDAGPTADRKVTLTIGRFDNPFFSSDVMWDDDLGFDGIALQGRYEVVRGVTPYFNAGAFPIFNTAFNFATNQPSKFESNDKYVYAIQGGVDVQAHRLVNFKAGAAYYKFHNVEGELSEPFVPLTSSDAGNTDHTRPLFAQKGNTYMALRNILPVPANNFGATNQFQYYGLASRFEPFVLTGKIDFNAFEPITISVFGEYIKNTAFDSSEIESKAVNNRGSGASEDSVGRFDGGDTAWIVGVRAGSLLMNKRWDWTVGANYRYVESDAVVDGFTDSDFGLGGTNVEGYSVFGQLALSNRVIMGIRWMASDEITGPPLRNDVLQIDLSAKF